MGAGCQVGLWRLLRRADNISVPLSGSRVSDGMSSMRGQGPDGNRLPDGEKIKCESLHVRANFSAGADR